MGETEKGIRELEGSFSTGNIQLNNRNHDEKIIFWPLQEIIEIHKKKNQYRFQFVH